MNATTVAWTVTIFFGCSVGFAAVRKLTEDSGRGVTLLAQVGLMALIIGVIVFIVRRNERE